MGNEKHYTTTASEALPNGTFLFNRYRIDHVLGQGGFGITYVAFDCLTQTPMAVKELFPSGFVARGPDRKTLYSCGEKNISLPHLQQRFQDEATLLMKLQGKKGVLKVTHLFDENNTFYYVMELLNGEDLSHRLKSHGAFHWQEFAPILLQIMDSLEAIHSMDLIHRDISPDNIFLTNDTGARLIDFGSVRAYQGSDHFTALLKQNFAPWEQYLTNGKQGPYTDIYALCVTSYYVLSGHLPPRAPERRMQDTVVPLHNYVPEIPQQVCQVIHTGMAVNPGDRYQTIAQFRAALMAAMNQPTPPAPHPIPPTVEHPGASLVCLHGIMAGRSWHLAPDAVLRIGRGTNCDVVYPPNAPGVSRNQCMVGRASDGQLLVRDEGSSCGTFLVGKNQILRLEPKLWYCVNGKHIRFGQQEEYGEADM